MGLKFISSEIKVCKICVDFLPFEPNPVFSVNAKSKVAIIGQAPGIKVHESGIPWNDQSGKNLREWMNVTEEQFYNPEIFSIIPMGFCYPGKGKTGDLPPRKECAPQWHEALFKNLPNLELILLIGSYAQKHYLKTTNLTNTVKNFDSYLPKYMVLPHPSPRNNIWMKKNDWFKSNNLPVLEYLIKSYL